MQTPQSIKHVLLNRPSFIFFQQRESKATKSPMKKPSPHNIPPRTLSSMPGLIKRSFVALNDYNPFTSSTATRPDLELPLAAGESVTVVGDVDANGYYTVEKGGIRWDMWVYWVDMRIKPCHILEIRNITERCLSR